ncbi:hypothetical protein ACFFK0_14740 [Paenibacillus chartarius]|uniref:Uncharacterized protein n=1 Tax=Paenibacillus chartarius TaxID=747481 RepID=A0ABV6DM28_9BACL
MNGLEPTLQVLLVLIPAFMMQLGNDKPAGDRWFTGKLALLLKGRFARGSVAAKVWIAVGLDGFATLFTLLGIFYRLSQDEVQLSGDFYTVLAVYSLLQCAVIGAIVQAGGRGEREAASAAGTAALVTDVFRGRPKAAQADRSVACDDRGD